MSAPQARVLLHVARDRRRAIDPEDVYFTTPSTCVTCSKCDGGTPAGAGR